jgi:hypothetical protein
MCCNGIDSYFKYRLDARGPAYLTGIATVLKNSCNHRAALIESVVRTTSPAAPRLIINTFMLEATKEFGLGAAEVEVPVVPPPLNAEDCEENRSTGDLSDNST